MQVITGAYRGRKLLSVGVGTRPTLTRIKESLFAIINDQIEGSNVLDLFAGSGALGIECISRGAKKTYFVDSSKEAVKVIQKNTERMQNFDILNKDYMSALKFFTGKLQFDLIFLDPPYESDFGEKSIDYILKNNLLASGGLIIFEHFAKKHLLNSDDLYIITRSKKYGDKVIDFITAR